MLAERSSRTPWHARHIAERHGLLVIIALGESVFGTVAALNALVHSAHGWTFEAALLAVAGIGLMFGLWWMYFVVPWGEVLERHRSRSLAWGTGHFLLFGSIAATGGGLHVAAYQLKGIAATAGVLVLAVACAGMGVSVPWYLLILMLAPVVTVVGYETVGHRHLTETMLSN